ncbi:adenine phosphoribosyltransferase [Prochlorococcus sp. AH-736-A21]|nr:adenine phosphoribosyltransferase [Prochlorococcus sp. AH-736-A21]
MLEKRLNSVIKDYPNFPINGILFRDLLPILENPELFSELIEKMSFSRIINDAEVLVGIDARGFVIASSIAFKAKKPLLLARKPGKLPGELVEASYELEYGKNSLSMQKESIKKYENFAIVDDLLATGGTINCLVSILKENKKNITGVLVVAELEKLNGRNKIPCPVESRIKL